MKHISLELEKLEQRIAPGVISADASASAGSKDSGAQGNNGYGNGGEDGVPGRSADNDSPNAAEKAADEVR